MSDTDANPAPVLAPTPYDQIIDHLDAITGQDGIDKRQRQMQYWRDLQAAYRNGRLDAQREPK